jgi:phospholipid/cholesterol/gamma-HCH transport system permease protein
VTTYDPEHTEQYDPTTVDHEDRLGDTEDWDDIPLPEGGGDDGSAEITWGTIGHKGRGLLDNTGEIGRFAADTFRSLPNIRMYPTEVFRQTAVLILGSGAIVMLMVFIMGLECGTEASYILKQFGAPLYSGIFDAYCDQRECLPYMWGWIFSAKVGCGLVAEIGSMRISEEIDVLEVMGVRPMGYIVAARFVGYMIAVPFLYGIATVVISLGSYFATIIQLKTVSSGGFLTVFFLFQSPIDLGYAFVKVALETMVIVLVGCYYGYTSGGGSVGVGKNTAKSMIVNMIMVSVVGVIGTLIFWGRNPHAPITN